MSRNKLSLFHVLLAFKILKSFGRIVNFSQVIACIWHTKNFLTPLTSIITCSTFAIILRRGKRFSGKRILSLLSNLIDRFWFIELIIVLCQCTNVVQGFADSNFVYGVILLMSLMLLDNNVIKYQFKMLFNYTFYKRYISASRYNTFYKSCHIFIVNWTVFQICV